MSVNSSSKYIVAHCYRQHPASLQVKCANLSSPIPVSCFVCHLASTNPDILNELYSLHELSASLLVSVSLQAPPISLAFVISIFSLNL
jgi:hypothetical protein